MHSIKYMKCIGIKLIGIKSDRFTFSPSFRFYAHLHGLDCSGAGEDKTPMFVWLEQLEEEHTEC